MKLHKNTKNITVAALVAALYVVLTLVSALFGLDKGIIQFRLSEILAVLPAFTLWAVPGLFLGCALASFLSGAYLLDVVFGSLVTLLAALVCYFMRSVRKHRYGAFLLPLPNVICNTLLIPLVLQYVYGVSDGYFFLVFTVGIGEILTSYVLGIFLYYALKKQGEILF